MSDIVIVAAITAGGTVAVALTAPILTFRPFGSLLRRLDAIGPDIEVFLNSGER